MSDIKLRFKKWRWPLLIAVVSLSGYLLIELWLGPHVDAYRVKKEELIQSIVANGKVIMPRQVEILSKYNGIVSELSVVEGDSIKIGQLLIKLENRDGRVGIEKAKIATKLAEAVFKKINEQTQAGSELALSRANASLENAKKEYARVNELVSKKLVSQNQAIDALSNLTIAHSQLSTVLFQMKSTRGKGSDFARAKLALAKARANERIEMRKVAVREIRSRTSGILLSNKLARGDKVMPGKTLMVISTSIKPRLLVKLYEKNMPDIKLGQFVTVVEEMHPEQHFDAILSVINPAINDDQKLVELEFEINNPPGFLDHDMSVSLELQVSGGKNILSLPVSYIYQKEGAAPWVMILDNNRAQRKPVKLGVRGKDKIEILEGLVEGNDVLPVTGYKIDEGKRFRLAQPG